MTSLEKLRVFDIRRYHPYTLNGLYSPTSPSPNCRLQLRYHLDFEGAMHPNWHSQGWHPPHLVRALPRSLDPFDRLPSDRVCRPFVASLFAASRASPLTESDSTLSLPALILSRSSPGLQNRTHSSLIDDPGCPLRKLVLLESTPSSLRLAYAISLCSNALHFHCDSNEPGKLYSCVGTFLPYAQVAGYPCLICSPIVRRTTYHLQQHGAGPVSKITIGHD